MARERLPRFNVIVRWKHPISGIKAFKSVNKDLAHAKAAEAAEMAIRGALFYDDGMAQVEICVERLAEKAAKKPR